MKKILFINTVCGFGSTGKIIEELTKIDNYDYLVCYGRKKDYAKLKSYKFANLFDNIIGAINTIIFDNNLNICNFATKRLIKRIKEYNPDIINIHNLHGYYVNVEMLLSFLKEYNKPIVLTLHDCWTMTGYCPHFDAIGCEKYKTRCFDCQYRFAYPFSIFKQNVDKDFRKKRVLFNSLNKLVIVTPSIWLSNVVKDSILKENRIEVIYNGIDLKQYKIKKKKNKKFTVLAVANVWTEEKGINELNKIIPLLSNDIEVIVIGKNSKKVKNVKSINRTNNLSELIDYYSSSHLFINPTLQETFGLVNVEANACGVPVITYSSGGSPETINNDSGIIIERYNYQKFADTVNKIKNNYYFNEEKIIKSAKRFSKDNMREQYKRLFDCLVKNNID